MSDLEIPIAIRAYAEPPDHKPLGSKPVGKPVDPSPWAVVFDCETRIDAAQQLIVGFFQVRYEDEFRMEGVFFDPESITEEEEKQIRDYAALRDLEIMPVSEFRRDVFIKYGYSLQGTIVGFNLPFDISRIATDHGSARGHMHGGFSFSLTRNQDDPRVRVKSLNARAALIDFMKPREQLESRGMRNREIPVRAFRGYFVDLRTLSAALWSRGFSLKTLAQKLQTPTQKHETEEHGEISERYLDYARADVQVTWECYQALKQQYAEHGLSQAISKILSEATIGKAYLQEMGIKPFLACDPDFDRKHFGQILCAYYGGRAEVRIRREIREIVYCDFKSMYPTVNALMGLWDFVTAEGIQARDTTENTKDWLESLSLTDLQDPACWRQLTTLVQIIPDNDVLPVRAKYNQQKSDTFKIGLNRLTSESPLWFTLADCINSKLQTGKTPRIIKAMTYFPGPRQSGLTSIQILGKDDYRINPETDDFFARLIDLRDEAKSEKDPIEKSLKIIANSTSYGIFIEIVRDDASTPEKLNVYGPNGECVEVDSCAIETPGRFFHPLLAVLITGAARLMLGIAEKLTIDGGLDWAFCDTDSLAIARTEGISRKEFREKAKSVIGWFSALNPYKKPGSILQIENINYEDDSEELRSLYCYAISAKRYALFNLDSDENPILRKASAHGLGYLVEPYTKDDAPPDLSESCFPSHKIGVKRWQHDLWIKIIEAALTGNPNQVPLNWHLSFDRPAAQRYAATSPRLLSWLKTWNRGKPYEEQIRPFGFLLSFMSKGVFSEVPDLDDCIVENPGRGRPPKREEPKPIAPYDSDPARALPSVFDRDSGEFVPCDRLKTYAEALHQYHLSSEDKFGNADFFDRGRTERRHVVATGMVLIGKEANRLGESGESCPLESAVAAFLSVETLSV